MRWSKVVGLLALVLGCQARGGAQRGDSASSGGSNTLEEVPAEASTVPPAPMPEPPAKGVNGRITTDHGGAAVPGARVCARILSSSIFAVRADVEKKTCVDAGSSGAFAIALEPGSYNLVATAEGFLMSAQTVNLRSSSPGAQVELDLERGGRLRQGRIVDLLGSPVAGATVRGFGFGDAFPVEDARATTDADGRFRMWSSGWGELMVQAPGFASNPRIPVGEDGDEEVLALVPEARLQGVVVDAEGNPVPGARVAPVRWFGRSTGNAWDAVRADAEGKFSFEGLPPGEYPILALTETRAGVLEEVVQLGLGETVSDLRIELSEPLQLLEVRTVDEEGSPVPRCRVELETDGGSTSPSIRTDHEGVGHVNVGPAKLVVSRVRCDGWVASKPLGKLTVVEGRAPEPLTIRVHRGGRLVGRLVSATGEPLAHLAVRAELDSRVENFADANREPISFAMSFATPSVGRTDLQGRFEISGLAPARYQIRFPGSEALEGDAPSIIVSGTERLEQDFEVPAVENAAPEKEPEPEPEERDRRTVQVRGPDGQPAPGAVVELAFRTTGEGGELPSLSWRTVVSETFFVTGPDGKAEVTGRAGRLQGATVIGARVGEIGITTLETGSDEPTVLKLVKSGAK